MARQATAWLHVNSHRFLLRRIECALLRGDLHSGTRAGATALAFGCALTAAALLAFAVLGLLSDEPGLGDARIVMGKASGALYVRVGDSWHPVLNLASARLIAATAADPQPVRESALAHTKRGPLLGIPGAPQLVARPLPMSESVWTICDTPGGTGTTVLIAPPMNSPIPALAADRAILVALGSGSPAYLFYDGRRAAVDLADHGVLHALRLSGQIPRIVSQSLLNAVPEAAPITTPRIHGAGAPAGAWLPGFAVGTVLRITRAMGEEYYVVLSTGVQRIGQVAADILRFRDSQGAVSVVAVAPDVLRTAPVVSALPVSGFPDQAPTSSEGGLTDSTLCVRWAPAQSGPANIALLAGSGPPVHAGQHAVALAQADGPGPAVDAVYLPPGRSAYVVSHSLAGELSGGGARMDTRYLVTDTGVRFAIRDDDAAHDLGLPLMAAPAPWPVLAGLPCGPELSRENASVARDTVAAAP